jgi:hypothetical protein
MYGDDVWRSVAIPSSLQDGTWNVLWLGQTDWTIGPETTIEHLVDGGSIITREYDQPEDHYRFEISNLLAWFTC